VSQPSQDGSSKPAGTGYLILHGWQNRRPQGHWQHWLSFELTALGRHVVYPQFPEPDAPRLSDWLNLAEQALSALTEPDRVIVCHSLGCLTWLHLVQRLQVAQPRTRVVLVAPPSPAFIRGETSLSGFELPLDDVAKANVRGGRLVCSDNDPFCPEGADSVYARPLGLDVDIIPDSGHLDMAAGYGSWPDVLRWCLDPSVRIGPRDRSTMLSSHPR
jgi:uncharacterized protein